MMSATKVKSSQKRKHKKDTKKSSAENNVVQIQKNTSYSGCNKDAADVEDKAICSQELQTGDKDVTPTEYVGSICQHLKTTESLKSDDRILEEDLPCQSDNVKDELLILNNSQINTEIINCDEILSHDQTLSGQFSSEQLDHYPLIGEVEEEAINYNKLLDDVKDLTENISEPSAPISDVSSKIKTSEHNENFSPSLYVNDCEKIVQNIIQKTNVIEFGDECKEDTLVPLCDEELTKFYYNYELNQCQDCINNFIENEVNNEAKILDPFYILLSNYYKAKSNLKINEHKIKDLDRKLEDCISEIWSVWNDMEIHEVKKCMDGNPIVVTHKYMQAKLNEDRFETFRNVLNELKSTLFEDVKKNSFNCLRFKIKIEQYIKSLLTSCSEFATINDSSPITLVRPSSDSFFLQCLRNLKKAIGILFVFQRKQKLDACSSFLTETRQWLTNLVSVLIRTGNWEDHLYVLNHILRCPPGVGKWAAFYVQFPESRNYTHPFSDVTINHMMTVLSILLHPIEKREEFINGWNAVMNPIDDNSWVIIDSDDEEEIVSTTSPLQENDLVLLLNQIPLKELFSSILGLRNGILNPVTITANHLMKLFSFCSDFIKIIHSGLQEYSTQRYKQFSKRLGRLILHIIEYVTDEYQYFKLNNGETPNELDRLQTEYDRFFLNSTKSIYSSRIYGTWQYLSVVPYHTASRSIILQLYEMLQLNDLDFRPNFRVNLTDFEEKFYQLPESEQFYLLSAFMNMALARNLSELKFMKVVVHQLFYIGFLGNLTKDQCYKNVKSLLYNLCSIHSFFMSDILQIQNEEFISEENCDLSLCICLWKELPVSIWKPTREDLQILLSWLLHPVQSVRSEQARTILKSLNFDSAENDLFLPAEVHREIAYMIMKANIKTDQDNEKNMMKNVSNMVGFQEPETILQTWSWNMLLKLRLHLCDQSVYSVRSSLKNLHHHLRNIPDVASDGELHQLVRQKNPIACFIALMTTTLGHSVPVIFNEGFMLLDALLRARKTEAAISCIEHLILMFLDCPDSLYKCQHFTSILHNLLTADYSYLKLTKNLKAFDTPGPVLISLESMIQHQIHSCEELGINRYVLIELWFKALTRIPLWIQEPGVIHILDTLCKNAFFDVGTTHMVRNLTSQLFAEISSSPTEEKSSFASLISWLNAKCTLPTLLARSFSENPAWYFLNVLKIEREIYETSNSLWDELLKELSATVDKKTNVDNCLKKACSNLQIPTRTSDVLAFYKLCHQILETRSNHPLIVLLWQQFFLLYLCRVPNDIRNLSVGEKFFHGIINQNLFRRLKQRLQESLDFFRDASGNCDKPNERRDYYSKCLNIFNMFSLWLDEPKLHAPHLNLHLLSPQFNSELLKTVIDQDATPWIEFLDYHQVQDEIRKSTWSWLTVRNRRPKNKSLVSPTRSQEKSLTDRIQDGLLRYENHLTFPTFTVQQNLPQCIRKDILLQPDSLTSFLKSSLKNMTVYSNCYVQEIGEHIGLGCDLQDLVKVLYKVNQSSITLRKTCDGTEQIINGKKIHFKCKGPAVVTLSFESSELDKKNNDLFKARLENFNRSLRRAMQPLRQELGHSIVVVEKAIEELKAEYEFMKNHVGGEKFVSNLDETGTALFYKFIGSWTDDVSLTPSVTETFEQCIRGLGKTFIAENPSQCHVILAVINNHPKLLSLLQEYFNPTVASAPDFVKLYSTVRNSPADLKLALLLRFDIVRWLTEKKPRFADRSSLISLIGSGLKSCGVCPVENHELVKILNSHLRDILMHDFPEHYGVILNLLMEGSDAQTIPVSTWFMFLNALAPEGVHFAEGKVNGSTFEPGQSVKKLKVAFTHYATHQNLLSLTDVRDTMLHIGKSFKADRLQHGLYGLYPKYRHYIEAIFIFCGMISHSYVAETVKLDLGSLSARITDQLWPQLRDLFSPWLVPYWSKQEKSQLAKWIQELTDDKCVLLPWVNGDSSLASFCSNIFIHSVRFVLDTLPGINNILSHVWFFYVTNYAHGQVKEHILHVIHKSLLQLPWSTFYPSLEDIELMVKVVEHFIPMAHSFLGNIFIEINWKDAVTGYQQRNDVDAMVKLHIYLLHLLVKLPCEPSLKQNNKIELILTEAKDYSWHLVDSNNYESVLNWFIMSCDPRIVLRDSKSDYHKLDSLILQILQNCAGYADTLTQFHPTTLTKRLIYIRANVRWLITSNVRFKCKDSDLFKLSILRILNEIESTANFGASDFAKPEELAMLLSEFLNIFKEEELIVVAEGEVIRWISSKKSAITIYGLLRSMRLSQINFSVFLNISEACLESYFESNDNPKWSEIISKIPDVASNTSNLLKAITGNNNILTYYSILLKNPDADRHVTNSDILINEIFQVLTSAKKSEDIEPKIYILVMHVCNIAEKVIEVNEERGILILSRLSSFLVDSVNDKGSGLLSTFGLRKSESFTNRFRFICLIAGCGIAILFKTCYTSHSGVDDGVLRILDKAGANKQFQYLGQCVTPATNEIMNVRSVKELIKILKDLGPQIFNKRYCN